MNKNSFLITLVALVIFFSTSLNVFASGLFTDIRDYTKKNASFATNILIARCNKCTICGKDIELMGDSAYQNHDYSSAKNYYLQAIQIYQQTLNENPSNRCVKNSLFRTKMKLKQFKK